MRRYMLYVLFMIGAVIVLRFGTERCWSALEGCNRNLESQAPGWMLLSMLLSGATLLCVVLPLYMVRWASGKILEGITAPRGQH